MIFVSYAQNLEDVLLWRALASLGEGGFYIDVGASDPEENSVTRAFYERNWRGVNVELEETAFAKLQALRPRDVNLRIVLGRETGDATFHRCIDADLSTLDPLHVTRYRATGSAFEQTRASIDTLASVCRRYVPGDIHFLKIGVNGEESSVIEGADFNRYRPWIVIIKTNRRNSQEDILKPCEPALIKAGYIFAHFDGLNRFYVVRDRNELLAAFSAPPNAFDDYVSVSGLKRLFQNDTQISILRDIVTSFHPPEESAAATAALTVAKAQASAAEALAAAETAARTSAEIRAAHAEAEAMAGKRDLLLLQAELARMKSAPIPYARFPATGPELRSAPPHDTEIKSVPNIRIFFDASLMLHHGYLSPVGLVRAEHYVAEILAKNPLVRLQFVVYDRDHASYRPITPLEEDTLQNILFRRYDPSIGPSTEIDLLPPVADRLAEQALLGNYIKTLRHRAGTALRMSSDEFAVISAEFLARLVPITADEPAPLRLGKRVVRRGVLSSVRVAHRFQAKARQMRRWLARCTAADKRADTPQSVCLPGTAGINTDALPGPGDVLISMANLWDYMDYGYLDRLCRRDGVRLVSVIYDVIAMELPFTTPGPPHIYHRHWIEIGHLSSHLLAISRYSADSYRRFISEPNGLPVSLSCAYLPNFLKARSDDIGEVSVVGLDQRPFVVYCSTIEIRKNHQLLLHVWDLLRQNLRPDQMPTLVFAGKWGWGAETVRQLVERNWRLRSHLRVLDRVSDAELIWLYRNARLSVFPSYSEGFGLAAAESLSFGTPVVISDCPALVEATEGLMPAHSPHDFCAWYQDMRRLLTDDARLEELRAAAKRYRGPTYDEFGLAVLNAARLAAAPKSRIALCHAA